MTKIIKKRKTKSLPKLKKECQIIFNEYIRLRDKGLPCISCGEFKILQCGHYYPVQGYDGLRYDEFNACGECSGCNCFDSSHLITYGENLLKRIGSAKLEELKKRAKEYKKSGYKFTRAEILSLMDRFKEKIKEIKAEG